MTPVATGAIGGRLQRAREQRGMTLRDAAERTKLSVSVLQAIERNDFDRLPGGLFRKAYVRTLAAEVGLDPNEIAADYCAQFEPPIEPALQPRRLDRQETLIAQLAPSPRPSLVTLAALAAAFAAWVAVQQPPVALTVPFAIAGGDPRPVARPAAVAAQDQRVPLRIDMVATGWCWVEAETDGAQVIYRLVAPGERVVLEGQDVISLRLGDAGAVTLSINDGPRRSPGRDGQVVELDVTPDNVERLRDVAAASLSGA